MTEMKKQKIKIVLWIVLLLFSIATAGICTKQLDKHDLPITYKEKCDECNTEIRKGKYCTNCGEGNIVLYHDKYCTTCDYVPMSPKTYCAYCGTALGASVNAKSLDLSLTSMKIIKNIATITIFITPFLFFFLLCSILEYDDIKEIQLEKKNITEENLINRDVLLHELHKRYQKKKDKVPNNLEEGFAQAKKTIMKQPVVKND